MRPPTVVVLDARAKARGALAKIATDRPHVFAGVAPMIEGGIVPVAGGKG
jgi:hypothetical protein